MKNFFIFIILVAIVILGFVMMRKERVQEDIPSTTNVVQTPEAAPGFHKSADQPQPPVGAASQNQ